MLPIAAARLTVNPLVNRLHGHLLPIAAPDIFGHKGAEVRVVFVPDPNRSSGSVDAAGKAFATPWLSLDGGIEAGASTVSHDGGGGGKKVVSSLLICLFFTI